MELLLVVLGVSGAASALSAFIARSWRKPAASAVPVAPPPPVVKPAAPAPVQATRPAAPPLGTAERVAWAKRQSQGARAALLRAVEAHKVVLRGD